MLDVSCNTDKLVVFSSLENLRSSSGSMETECGLLGSTTNERITCVEDAWNAADGDVTNDPCFLLLIGEIIITIVLGDL